MLARFPHTYQQRTQQAYNTHPEHYAVKFDKHFHAYVQPAATRFLSYLQGTTILDLGAGPGIHAAYFKKQGADVLCIDNSEEMINLCTEKGLQAKLQDIEHLDLSPHTFDGLWAYASLLHLPRATLRTILPDLLTLLKPEGIIGIALKEGTSEGLEHDEHHPDVQRYFTYYTPEEIKTLFEPRCTILSSTRMVINEKNTFLNYLLQLK